MREAVRDGLARAAGDIGLAGVEIGRSLALDQAGDPSCPKLAGAEVDAEREKHIAALLLAEPVEFDVVVIHTLADVAVADAMDAEPVSTDVNC